MRLWLTHACAPGAWSEVTGRHKGILPEETAAEGRSVKLNGTEGERGGEGDRGREREREIISRGILIFIGKKSQGVVSVDAINELV